MQPFRSLLTGLGTALLAAGPTIAAAADAPSVVASIKPVHSLLAGVMEGAGRPELLLRGGASPHTYSLRPSEARALEGADLVVWVGEEIESFLESPLRSLADNAYVLELSRIENITLLPMREGGTWDEHEHVEAGGDQERRHGEAEDGDEHHEDGDEHHEDGDEHHEDGDEHHEDGDEHHEDGDEHHEDGDEHEHVEAGGDQERRHGEAEDAHVHHEDGHEHGRGEFNMHLWLDPANAMVIVEAMADALSLVDPERSRLYRDNAAAVRVRLEALDAELQEALAPVADRGFIVFHDAWAYFDTRYGLRAVGSVTLSPEQAPGAARLAEIREKLVSAGAECVFAEPQFEPRLVRTLVINTGAATGTLDPLGVAIEDGPDLYFTLMRSNATAFRACFGR